MLAQHTVRSYDDELKYLAQKIAEMGGHAERMVDQSIKALVKADTVLAKQVVLDDRFMDDTQREIDE